MKGLGFLKWDLYARANDPTFNRYCHKFIGYGFEVFVETAILLRKNDGNPLVIEEAIEDLAITTGLDVEKVKSALLSAINDYKLFKTTNDGKFYSNRVCRDVRESFELSKKRSEASKGKGKNKESNHQLMNNCQTIDEQLNDNCELDKREEIKDKSTNTNDFVLSNTDVLSNTSPEMKNHLTACSDSSPVFLEFPTLKGGKWNLTEEQVSKWEKAYPAVDVKQQVQSALSWLEANPKEAKSNIPRFLNNWLMKNQDKARTYGANDNMKGRQMMATADKWKAEAEKCNTAQEEYWKKREEKKNGQGLHSPSTPRQRPAD